MIIVKRENTAKSSRWGIFWSVRSMSLKSCRMWSIWSRANKTSSLGPPLHRISETASNRFKIFSWRNIYSMPSSWSMQTKRSQGMAKPTEAENTVTQTVPTLSKWEALKSSRSYFSRLPCKIGWKCRRTSDTNMLSIIKSPSLLT